MTMPASKMSQAPSQATTTEVLLTPFLGTCPGWQDKVAKYAVYKMSCR